MDRPGLYGPLQMYTVYREVTILTAGTVEDCKHRQGL